MMLTPILAYGQTLAPDPRHKEQRLAWWREARFGMFIHWGVYSVPAGDVEGQADRAASASGS